MATKKTTPLGPNSDLNDLDLDNLLPPMPGSGYSKDDRKPLTRVVKGFAQGAKVSATSPSTIKKVIAQALPQGYSTAVNLAESALGGTRELYNTAASDLKHTRPILQRATARALPKVEKYLPKGVARRLDEFTKQLDGYKPTSQSELDQREITATLLDVFRMQTQTQAAMHVEAETKQELRHTIANKRQDHTYMQLLGMRAGIERQVAYQDQVTAKYQQKSLELRYRQYFLARDAFKLQAETASRDKLYFDALVKNTGLPEETKLRNSERYKSTLRDKLYGSSQQAIAGYINNFGRQLKQNLMRSLRNGTGAVNQMAQAGQMVGDIGGLGFDPLAEGAGAVGGGLTQLIMRSLASKARPYVSKIPGAKKGGDYLSYNLGDVAERLNEYARSPTRKGGLRGFAEQILKNHLPRHFNDLTVGRSPMEDADMPAPFNNQARRSLTEVIPGFLSRIYHELQIMRTGDVKLGRTVYSLDKGQFVTEATAARDASKRLIHPTMARYAQEGVNRFTDYLDPKSQLSSSTRTALMRQLATDATNGTVFSAKRLTDQNSDTGHLDAKHKAELAAIFGNRFVNPDGSINYAAGVDAQQRSRNLHAVVPNLKPVVEAYMQTGQRELLEKLGLVESSGLGRDKINEKRMLDLLLGNANFGPEGPAAPSPMGGVRGMGPTLGPTRAGAAAPAGGEFSRQTQDDPLIAEIRELKKVLVSTLESNRITEEARAEVELLTNILDVVSTRNFSGATAQGVAEALSEGGQSQSMLDRQSRFGILGRWGGKLARGTYSAGKAGAKLYWKGLKLSARAAMMPLTTGARLVGGVLGGTSEYLSDVKVRGKFRPALYAKKIRNGDYIDKNTGKVIRSLKDITGIVLDENGDEVLTADDYASGLYDSRGRRILKGVLGGALGIARLYGNLAMVPVKAVNLAFKGVSKLNEFIKRPRDMYVKGERNPRLYATVMKAGGYFDRKSGKVIHRPKDVVGEVVDHRGNVILSFDDIQKGVVDVSGKPFGGLMAKLGRAALLPLKVAGKLAGGVLNVWGAMGRAGLDMFAGLLRGIGGIFNPKIYTTTTKQTNGLLERILKVLETRLPETKRVRKGSWEDQMAHRKSGGSSAGAAAKTAGGTGMFGSLLNWLRGHGRDEDEDDEDEDGDTNIDIDARGRKKGGFGRNLKSWLKRGGRKLGRSKLGRLASRFGGKLANSRVGGVIGRGLSRLGGSRALGGLARAGGGILRAGGGLLRGGLALAGLGEGAGALGAIGGGLASAAGGIGSAALGIGGAVAEGAAAVAGVLSAPVLLAGAAVAAVGTAAYVGYKYYQLKKSAPLRKLRMAQYGVDIGKSVWPMGKILELEDKLKDHVSYGPGGAHLNMDKVDPADLFKIFGITPSWYNPMGWFHSEDNTDRAKQQALLAWINGRFKPVFLSWMTLLHSTDAKVGLDDLDDKLSAANKRKFLDLATSLDSSVYGVTASPFGDDPLTAGPEQVAAAAKEARTAIDKEEKSHKSKAAGVAAGTALAATSKSTGAAVTRLTKDGTPATPSTASTAANTGTPSAAEQAVRKDLSKAAAVVTLTATTLPKNISLGNTLSALRAVRYKTMGLTDMTPSQVRALYLLEGDVLDALTYNPDGLAQFTDSPELYFKRYMAYFSITPQDEGQRKRWMEWFANRFLPTLLQFASAVKRANKGADPMTAEDTLRPAQLVDVAQAMVAATFQVRGHQASVWMYVISPFGDDAKLLNGDSRTVDGNIAVLKANISKRNYDQQTTEQSSKLQRGGTANNAKTPDAKPAPTPTTVKPAVSMAYTLSHAQELGTVAGVKADSAAGRRILEQMRKAGGGAPQGPVGQVVAQPGKGTGGDINTIPQPSGGGWKGVGPTIVAAAKAAGVDPSLMATIANIESGFDPSVKAGTSSATGLFQFTSGTWDRMMTEFAGKYGIDPSTPPTDARANALLGAEFLKQNQEALKNKLGRNPTNTELYLAHFLGAGGASSLLAGSSSAIAASLRPAAAKANYNIFYKKGGVPRTVGELVALMDQKVSKHSGWNVSEFDPKKMLAKGPASDGNADETAATPTKTKAPVFAKMVAPSSSTVGQGNEAVARAKGADVDKLVTAQRTQTSMQAMAADQHSKKLSEEGNAHMGSMVSLMGKQLEVLTQVAQGITKSVDLLDGIHGNTALTAQVGDGSTPTESKTPPRGGAKVPSTAPIGPVNVQRSQVA